MKNAKTKAAVAHKSGKEDATQPTGERLPTLPQGARIRGRKRISESRATELRARLVKWQQQPESLRGSLRALATKMGTSHQLLSFYLRHWDRWQAKEYKRKANDICARAKAENRILTGEDQAQIVAYLRTYIQLEVVSDALAALRKEARRGKLSRQHLRLAKLLADRGYGREIQEILAASGLGVCGTESLERGKC